MNLGREVILGYPDFPEANLIPWVLKAERPPSFGQSAGCGRMAHQRDAVLLAMDTRRGRRPGRRGLQKMERAGVDSPLKPPGGASQSHALILAPGDLRQALDPTTVRGTVGVALHRSI